MAGAGHALPRCHRVLFRQRPFADHQEPSQCRRTSRQHGLQLIEPLRDLFKDEVRRIGRELEMPSAILERQPFPGPGLAVRILGEVSPERVALLQKADDIVVTEIKAAGLYSASGSRSLCCSRSRALE